MKKKKTKAKKTLKERFYNEKKKNIKDIKSYIEKYMKENQTLCKFEIECIMKKHFVPNVYYAFAFDYENNLIILTMNNTQISTTKKCIFQVLGMNYFSTFYKMLFLK